MKRILFSIFLLTGIASFAQGGDKKTPPLHWLFSTSSDITLQHVVKTDTAVLLHIKVNATRREWKISSKVHLVADGKELAYRGGMFLVKEGKQVKKYPFLLDQPNPVLRDTIDGQIVYLRDSLLLSFDPMPANANEFDFIESNDFADRGRNIIGVKWDGKPHPSVVPARTHQTAQSTLPTYTPTFGKAVLRGRIFGYRKRLGGNGIFQKY